MHPGSLTPSLGASNVHLTTLAGDLVDHTCQFLLGEGSFTLVSSVRRVGPDLKTTHRSNFSQVFLILSHRLYMPVVVSSHLPGILCCLVPHPTPPLVVLMVPVWNKDTWKSAIAKCQVDWDGTTELDRAARPVQLKVKEALHIERTPANKMLN